VRDVLDERPVRTDDEDALAREPPPVRVEEPGSAVQADGSLAGAGPALDYEYALQAGRDQAVLIGLDRRDDVAHVLLAASLELLEQEVAERRRLVVDGAAEHLVSDLGEPPGVKP